MFSINQNSCKELSLLEFAEFSKHFQGVELNFETLKSSFNQGFKLKDLFETLETFDTRVSSIFQLADFSLSRPKTYKRKILPTFTYMMESCQQLETRLLIVKPSSLKGFPRADAIPDWKILRRTEERLRDLCKRSYPESITIGYEFVRGKHASISEVKMLEQLFENLEDQVNLKLILDSFYLFKEDFRPESLDPLIDRTSLIQVSGMTPDYSNERLTMEESDRSFPNENDEELLDLLKHARKRGYQGDYSLELNQARFEDLTAKKVHDKFLSLFRLHLS